MRCFYFTVMTFLAVNTWWMFFVFALPHCNTDNGMGLTIIPPILFTLSVVIPLGINIVDNWDNKE